MILIHRVALSCRGLLAFLPFMPGLALAQSSAQEGQAQIVARAPSAQFAGSTLRLRSVPPSSILFANR